jgi:uncharacterized membrane protein
MFISQITEHKPTNTLKNTQTNNIRTSLTENIYTWYKSLYKNLHWIYLLIAAPFSIVMCLVVPPLSGADEWAHFARAVEVSGGKMMGEQGEKGGNSKLPSSVLNFLVHPSLSPAYYLSDSKIEIEKISRTDLRNLVWTDDEAIVSNPFVAYPPTSYVPSSTALFISKIAGLHLTSSFYLGRLFTAIFALALAATTILLLERGKWLAFFFLSTPAVLYLFGSYAQDAMLISYSAIAIALFDYWRRNEFSQKKSNVILIASAIFFSAAIAARPPYLPLAFLLPIYLIFFKKDTLRGLIIFTMLIGYPLIWASLAAPLVHHNQFPGIDEYAQTKFILAHPLSFISALLNSSIQWQAIFGLLGSTALPLPSYAYKLSILALAILAINEQFAHRNPLQATFRFLTVAAFVGCAFLMMTVSYICWTPLESETSFPLLGRYLLPLVLLSILIPGCKVTAIPRRYYWAPLFASTISIAIIVLVNITGALTVVHGYLFIR